MSKNFIEAAILQLRGKGIEHLAAIETLVEHPRGISEHTNYVGEIMNHAKKAAECDEAVKMLQMYFIPKRAPPPQAAPVPVPTPRPGGPVQPAQSPTMRKAMAVQAPKPEPKRRTRKKKED